jgi:hypothetical protein
VLQEEILVAPGLEARVLVGAERRQRIAAGAMEMHRVLFEAVVGRQVHAAAEPAHGLAARRQRGQHAHVHVHGGHIGVARVEHQRHAHRLEGGAGQLGAMLGGRVRQLVAAYLRKAAAGALEQWTLFEDAGQAAPLQRLARLLAPLVAKAGSAVGRFERAHDALLQTPQVIADCLWILAHQP